MALVGGAPPTSSADDFESRLKVEMIERFLRFIEWPESALERQSFVVGLYGRGAMAEALRELAERQPLKDRPARFVELADPAEAAGCDLVFITASARRDLGALLTHTDGQAILTVGDSPGFADQGVLINFFREGDYLRFEVNVGAVERSGLSFSSKILRLAELVGDG